ncbi:A-kinase anchor protein 200-like isoform X2 [Plodia interpunctella]|uniref:A-kinase anchor protein 200-like isoform X2 n=1 Tax=Plodia interpunctella TaxID=58824 RepID=UPI002367689E|nr:A-kinase anchor protein 200-like isoform X2 [Plodia interpunctella]
MGAKQSKRSVDISGKEAENVGEVAVAGAGGEGRMEPLADADALKPQINGDAHIHEQSDKEKQLDSGTPENEKDATTEKEGKEQEENKEKEAAPVTNGENGEQKENGDSSPAPEDGKKPKKEKVKKKWSLRSISFSRKEKPKQEKKQKEEEPKTNGEPEKVPEEAAEVTPEAPKTESAEEPKLDTESKDEKTPETPVTEPITNGTSTPESKVETPAEEPAVAIPETNRPEPKAEPEPEQLPVNGLSLEEAKHEAAEAPQSEESKPEEPIAETTESTPAPEIPVIKEEGDDCKPEENAGNEVQSQIPNIDAEIDLTARLNEVVEEVKAEPLIEEVKAEPVAHLIDSNPIITNEESENDLPPPLNEVSENENIVEIVKPASEELPIEKLPEVQPINNLVENSSDKIELKDELNEKPIENVESEAINLPAPITEDAIIDEISESEPCISPPAESELPENPDALDSVDDLPPPPPVDDLVESDIVENFNADKVSDKVEVISNHVSEIISETNGIDKESINGIDKDEIVKGDHVDDTLGKVVEPVECNGNGITEDPKAAELSSAAAPAQEPLPVSDKIADLIPEVPVVPELKTESETTTDVAVN